MLPRLHLNLPEVLEKGARRGDLIVIMPSVQYLAIKHCGLAEWLTSYSGGRDQENGGLKPPWANSL
jgi:hypothetical protein